VLVTGKHLVRPFRHHQPEVVSGKKVACVVFHFTNTQQLFLRRCRSPDRQPEAEGMNLAVLTRLLPAGRPATASFSRCECLKKSRFFIPKGFYQNTDQVADNQ
jgi:hypothetical protein